jgi:hypothetical protein
LTLVAGQARADLPLECCLSPPLMFTGVGRVGVGATPDAFALLTRGTDWMTGPL